MSIQRSLAALVLSLTLPAAAHAQDSYSERYDLEIHLSGFMNRLYEVLTRPEWLGQHQEVAAAAGLMKEFGVFNLENIQCEYAVENGQVALRCAEHYANLDPESYYGKVFALPNKPLALAGYVPSDAVLYLGINNVPQHALLLASELGELAQAQQAAGGPLAEMFGDAEVAQVFGMLEAFNVEQQVNDALTGEVGLAVFAAPSPEDFDNFGPEDIAAAVLVGVKDAERVKQLIGLAAQQAPLVPMGEMEGGWTGWYVQAPMAPAAGIMLGPDMLFVTPDVPKALASIDFSRSAQTTPACQAYFDLNVSRLHDELVGPGLGLLMSEAPVDLTATKDAARYLFALPPSDALGHIRGVTVYDSGYECAITMNTALANYLFYYVGVGASAAAQSEMGKQGGE
jgi:hypothetical protein